MRPEFISARQEGSFALLTITKRLPYIVEQTIVNNELDIGQKSRLEKLKAEIPHERFRMPEYRDDDYPYWEEFLKIHTGNWLEEPFMAVEFYMYRRIAEAVGFFSNGFDPFRYKKLESLHGKIDEIITIAGRLKKRNRPFGELLMYNLWGNRADLSQFNQPGSYLSGSSEKNTVINDVDAAVKLLESHLGQVDILLDNSGLELAVDLIFVYYLLEEKVADRIWLHAKRYPIFVSDVMPVDIMYTVEYFIKSSNTVLEGIGEKLSSYIGDGAIVIETNPFWTLPEPFENFTAGLKNHLSKSDLVISKGDLNYRRLAEDRCWPYDTDVREVVGYFPANILTVRSMKSELMLGITKETARRLFEEDPDWLVNGKYGMIQLIERTCK